MQYNFPFRIDIKRGQIATANNNDHILQMIEQVLFTIIGERVNRPTFGSNINQLIFGPNSEKITAATQFLIQGALQQHLAELIYVQSVEVSHEESILRISVQYIIRRSQDQRIAKFSRRI